MGRFLLLIAGVVLLFFALRSFAKNGNKKKDVSKAGKVENMVRCAYCGVHLPAGESISSRGEFFCSDEHRRLRQV